jgi:hypothetical protein
MNTNEIKQTLINVAEYLNDNYGPDESHPKGVIVYPYTDKVVFTCWECGAIVYINGGIYYISEDDGYWWVNKSTFQDGNWSREAFGYNTSGISIGWAKDIAEALIRLNQYIEENGTPVYYVGIEPKRICHYVL